MPPIRIAGLTKTHKDGPRAVDHVDLEIRDGEFMVLVGPSGCGKSTLLQNPDTGGAIALNGAPVAEHALA